jgi:hypothetical protein
MATVAGIRGRKPFVSNKFRQKHLDVSPGKFIDDFSLLLAGLRPGNGARQTHAQRRDNPPPSTPARPLGAAEEWDRGN